MMKKIRISAKDLVMFLYSAGDLSYEKKAQKNKGTELHTYLQNQYQIEDEKEVFVETLFTHDTYSLHITGRIDGVLRRDKEIIIEEIKLYKDIR